MPGAITLGPAVNSSTGGIGTLTGDGKLDTTVALACGTAVTLAKAITDKNTKIPVRNFIELSRSKNGSHQRLPNTPPFDRASAPIITVPISMAHRTSPTRSGGKSVAERGLFPLSHNNH